MNRDEGSYQLSHAYDRFLHTASSRRVKNRKNLFTRENCYTAVFDGVVGYQQKLMLSRKKFEASSVRHIKPDTECDEN